MFCVNTKCIYFTSILECVMRVAIIGLNMITAKHLKYDFPQSGSELITCGKSALTPDAECFAASSGLMITRVDEGPSMTETYCRMIHNADGAVIFWDGHDTDILNAAEYCRMRNVPCTIHTIFIK